MRFNSPIRALLAAIALAILSDAAVGAGPDTTNFHVAALTALKEASSIATHSKHPAVSQVEWDFFADAADGKFTRWNLSNAALVASGIHNDTVRKHYLEKIDDITEQAREAVVDDTSSIAKARTLAAFLHREALHGGFESGQVDMRRLLDEGKYNCVSSAILYGIISTRLGIKCSAVTIPSHVFIRMSNFYIEPTSGRTYTAAQHERVLDKEWAKATPSMRDRFGDLRMYESGKESLIAAVYFDRGCAVSGPNEYEQAAILDLKAVCLDAKCPSFVRPLKHNLTQWFKVSVKKKQFTKAKTIAAIYGQLFGDDSQKLFKELTIATRRRTARS